MAGHESRLWTDRSWLRDVQYRTEAHLAARQSPYACQPPATEPACLVAGDVATLPPQELRHAITAAPPGPADGQPRAVLAMSASSSTAMASPAGHRACTPGSYHYTVDYGPPGFAGVDWQTASSPSGCEQIRVVIESQQNLTYGSGYIKNTGIDSSQNTCADSSDCSPLQRAWLEERPTGDSADEQCKKVYPEVQGWFACSKVKILRLAPAR